MYYMRRVIAGVNLVVALCRVGARNCLHACRACWKHWRTWSADRLLEAEHELAEWEKTYVRATRVEVTFDSDMPYSLGLVERDDVVAQVCPLSIIVIIIIIHHSSFIIII